MRQILWLTMLTPPSIKEIGTTEVQVPQMDVSVYY